TQLLYYFHLAANGSAAIKAFKAGKRIFRELRKRTRPMCSFANIACCDRIVYCLFTKSNKKWKEHRYHVAI
ncbi:MAG: hypothetical protein ACUVQ4_09520, partial [bacterium]